MIRSMSNNYLDDSTNKINDLINLYFKITDETDMEIQLAGDEQERDLMMPFLRI